MRPTEQGVYGASPLATAEHALFPSSRRTLPRTDHIRGHNTHLDIVTAAEVASGVVRSDHRVPSTSRQQRPARSRRAGPSCAGAGDSNGIAPIRRTVWSFHKTLKMELPDAPASPLLGTYPRDSDRDLQETAALRAGPALPTTAKTRRPAEGPAAAERVKDVMEHRRAVKKDVQPRAVAGTNLEDRRPREVSQPPKDGDALSCACGGSGRGACSVGRAGASLPCGAVPVADDTGRRARNSGRGAGLGLSVQDEEKKQQRLWSRVGAAGALRNAKPPAITSLTQPQRA